MVIGAFVVVVEPGTVVAGAEVDVAESGVVLVVVSEGAEVVSLVVESEQETAINDAASTNPMAW